MGNISRILENVADSDFQYFQDPRTPEKADFQYFQASENIEKPRFPIFPGLWRMLETAIFNISRILENVADLVNQIIKYGAVRNRKMRFPIFPGIQKYKRKTVISNISRILENVGDFNLQYFQDSGECCRPREPNN